MVEQMSLTGLDSPVDLCACGCGRPVPPTAGRGRPARYASPACRVRAHRISQNPVPNFVTSGAPVSEPAPTVSTPTPATVDAPAAVVEDGGGAEERKQLTRRDLRQPYTDQEYEAILAALRGERARRKVDHLPRGEQMEIVDRVLISLRRPA